MNFSSTYVDRTVDEIYMMETRTSTVLNIPLKNDFEVTCCSEYLRQRMPVLCLIST